MDEHKEAGYHEVHGPYDAETGRQFDDDELAALQAHAQHLMEGHRERVANFERTRPSARVPVRRPRKPYRMTRDLTAAQLRKREKAAHDIDLQKQIMDSGLWDGIPHSRRVWCARLRELELHPERLEQIKARSTPGQLGRRAAAEAAIGTAAAGA
jgi:hypothetical protein